MRFILAFIKKLFGLGADGEAVCYICGGDALPAPLSAEEEESAMARAACGDVSVKAVLIERNLRLVVYIARKFENTAADLDDLISVGTIGLIKAVNSFDCSKKIKLATYASRCIENEILMYLRRVARLRAEVSFDEPLNVDWEGNELLLSDILGTEPDLVCKNIENSVEKELLWQAVKKLNKREQEIMKLRFGLTYSGGAGGSGAKGAGTAKPTGGADKGSGAGGTDAGNGVGGAGREANGGATGADAGNGVDCTDGAGAGNDGNASDTASAEVFAEVAVASDGAGGAGGAGGGDGGNLSLSVAAPENSSAASGEKTQKEVADMLGISQSYISRLEKKIIGRLKKEISKVI